MAMPFTVEQFFDVFRRYNEAIWPLQWVLVASAVLAVFVALRGGSRADRAASMVLAVLWLWAGVMYHLVFFRTINPVAVWFGVLFVSQGALLAWFGLRCGLTFHPRGDGAGIAGGVLLLYVLVLYPVLGHALGHRYPAAPTFGLPCPLTIFTFGLLLWARPPVPRSLLVIPTLWAIVGTVAALRFGVREDFGLLVAAVLAASVLLVRGGRRRHALRPA